MTEPRDPRELLGMLAARVQHFAMAPGGIPALTQLDMAHVLGLISNPNVALYARVKYVGESEMLSELADALFRHAAVNLDVGKWRVPQPSFIRDLCRLAIIEDIDPHICPWCGGCGHSIVENRLVHCDGCGGTGRQLITDKHRANIMRSTPSAWAHSWRDKYREIQAIPSRWDDVAKGAIGWRSSTASIAS